jgi:hypothetical protein
MQNKLEKYIQVFEGVVSDDLCDRILAEYVDSQEWIATFLGDLNTVDKSARSATAIGISSNTTINANPEVRYGLDKELFQCAADVISKYKDVYPLAEIEQDSGYDLLRYEEGQFYIQHTDSCKVIPRTISCSFALNADYEGGEWGFWDRSLTIKIPKGAAILFPSNFMYPHEIMPVTKGTRYSVVTWFI